MSYSVDAEPVWQGVCYCSNCQRQTATALSLTMGISEILGGVLAPSLAGKAADFSGLGATLWILAGIVAAIIVLAALLRETAPAVLARRKLGAR